MRRDGGRDTLRLRQRGDDDTLARRGRLGDEGDRLRPRHGPAARRLRGDRPRSAAAPCRAPAHRRRAPGQPSPDRAIRRWHRGRSRRRRCAPGHDASPGCPAAAVPPMPALMPGMMRKRTPAAASASASSPPRPNTSGSPPFSRTTRWPSRARRISRSLMRSCGVRRPPARLPTGSSRACGASARISGETSASCSTTSASARACAACSVSRPGSPGPAPTSQTVPGSKTGAIMPATRWPGAARRVSSAAFLPSRRHAARRSRKQREATRPLGPILACQPRADARRQARTGATRRHGQQQIAATDLGDAMEVAQRRAVLDVDQHALRRAAAANSAALSSGSPTIHKARSPASSARPGRNSRSAVPAARSRS